MASLGEAERIRAELQKQSLEAEPQATLRRSSAMFCPVTPTARRRQSAYVLFCATLSLMTV